MAARRSRSQTRRSTATVTPEPSGPLINQPTPGQERASALLATLASALNHVTKEQRADVGYAIQHGMSGGALKTLLEQNAQLMAIVQEERKGTFSWLLEFLGLGMKVNTAQLMAISNMDDQIVRQHLCELEQLAGTYTAESNEARKLLLERIDKIQARRHRGIGAATWWPICLAFASGLAASWLGAYYGFPLQ